MASPMTTTYVIVSGDGEWPSSMATWIIHREDLSDLAEPYLSAVKEARALRASWRAQEQMDSA